MLIRKLDIKDSDKYYKVTNNYLSYELQVNGFFPKYIDKNALYFVKTKELLEYINAKEIDNERIN